MATCVEGRHPVSLPIFQFSSKSYAYENNKVSIAQDPSPSHHFPPGSKQFFSELLRQGLLVGCLSRAFGEEGLLGARSGSFLVPIYKGTKNTYFNFNTLIDR